MVKARTLIDALSGLRALPVDRARLSRSRAAATSMPAGTPCRSSLCSATRCISRSIRALASCAARSSPRPTSRTRRRFGLVQGDERTVYADRGYDGWWYRRSWPSAASTTASWLASIASARSTPSATPSTARSADPGASRAHLRHPQAPLRLHSRPLPPSVQERSPAAAARPRLEPAPRARPPPLRADSVSTRPPVGLASSHRPPHAPSDRSVTSPRRLRSNTPFLSIKDETRKASVEKIPLTCYTSSHVPRRLSPTEVRS